MKVYNDGNGNNEVHATVYTAESGETHLANLDGFAAVGVAVRVCIGLHCCMACSVHSFIIICTTQSHVKTVLVKVS